MSKIILEACARAAHEANRAYSIAIGDTSEPSWETAPEWMRQSTIHGVKMALEGATPEQLHQSWLAEKEASGWQWGEVKNAVKKLHPCMVPYEKLAPEQRAKDSLFGAIVRATAAALQHGISALAAEVR